MQIIGAMKFYTEFPNPEKKCMLTKIKQTWEKYINRKAF